jgi:hypothetical protein
LNKDFVFFTNHSSLYVWVIKQCVKVAVIAVVRRI